jgi:MFS transporter, UMF1 family
MNFRRAYPLDGFPHQRQLWSWISFDVANQSFTLLINTLLFPIFFAQIVVCNDRIDDRIWSLTFGGSMLLTAVLSPLAGAAADERGWRKRCLIGSGVGCGVLTCGLAFIQPGQLWLAVLLYVPANFAFAIGENFLASFLPGLARLDQVGRVSGFSWAVAYGAALVLLVLTAVTMTGFSLQATAQWRPFFVFAGLWFIAFSIPTILWLREPPLRQAVPAGRNLLVAGFGRLAESVRNTSRYRDLTMLLVSSLFFGTGMSVVVFFASKLAEEFGFSQVKLVVFVGVITVSGILGRSCRRSGRTGSGTGGPSSSCCWSGWRRCWGSRGLRSFTRSTAGAGQRRRFHLAAVADRKPAGVRAWFAGLGQPGVCRLPGSRRGARRRPSASGAWCSSSPPS